MTVHGQVCVKEGGGDLLGIGIALFDGIHPLLIILRDNDGSVLLICSHKQPAIVWSYQIVWVIVLTITRLTALSE